MKKYSPFDNFPILGTLKKTGTEYEAPSELEEPKDILAEARERPAFRLFYILGVIVVGALLIRLLNLQVTHGYENRYIAEGNRIRFRELEPSRGIINDSQGNPLVRNIPSYYLEIYPADLPKSAKKRQAIYQKIHQVTKVPLASLQAIEKKGINILDSITLKENLARDDALVWESQLVGLQGVSVTKRPRRDYSTLAASSHLLGYVGKISVQDLPKSNYSSTSRIGKAGLEAGYESTLRGKPGREQIEVDAQGTIQRVLSRTAPEAGHNIILNLNSELQTATYEVLNEYLIKSKSSKGSVVVMNPQTGGILSMVSLPAYDNNLFARGITSKEYQTILKNPDHLMLNRAISGTYPTGSTLKPVVAAAALEAKVVTENTTLDTSAGEIKIGKWVFPDWTRHGTTSVRQAIAESNDIFFYSLGGGWKNIKGLGINRLASAFRQFGFGAPTGIELPAEAKGLVPDNTWKKKTLKEGWYVGDTYHIAIGQGYFLATPLQLANATAAIANGGELLKPHLVAKIVDNNGNIVKVIDKEVVRSKFINAHNVQVVKEGMRLAVTGGSARSLNNLPVPAAAKTGTAQFADNQKTHAWFTAFAPYDKPEILVVVVIEGGGEGHQYAAPVAKKILETYFKK